MTASATASKPPTKRGRKPNSAKWLRLEDLADIVRWKVADLERLLDRVPGTFPGAIKGQDGWEVPERDVRALLGVPVGPLPQFATVKDVADSLRKAPKTVYWWLTLKTDDGKPLLPHTQKLGTTLILASDVLALPERMPESGRASFFSDTGGEA